MQKKGTYWLWPKTKRNNWKKSYSDTVQQVTSDWCLCIHTVRLKKKNTSQRNFSSWIKLKVWISFLYVNNKNCFLILHMQYKNNRISYESLFFHKSLGVYWNFVSFQLSYLKLQERHTTSGISFISSQVLWLWDENSWITSTLLVLDHSAISREYVWRRRCSSTLSKYYSFNSNPLQRQTYRCRYI